MNKIQVHLIRNGIAYVSVCYKGVWYKGVEYRKKKTTQRWFCTFSGKEFPAYSDVYYHVKGRPQLPNVIASLVESAPTVRRNRNLLTAQEKEDAINLVLSARFSRRDILLNRLGNHIGHDKLHLVIAYLLSRRCIDIC